jgi:hypothetical protein
MRLKGQAAFLMVNAQADAQGKAPGFDSQGQMDFLFVAGAILSRRVTKELLQVRALRTRKPEISTGHHHQAAAIHDLPA